MISSSQFGGSPVNPGWHVHQGLPLTSLHSAFIPHGDGSQGVGTGGGVVVGWIGTHVGGSPVNP